MPSAWDAGPSCTGALAVDAGTQLVRGTDAASFDLQLAGIHGAVPIDSGVAWLLPAVDALFRSGEAIEFRWPDARDIIAELSDAGVSVTTE
ncbi:hypothetical protein GCM10010104_35790 [Streptomyces indiaensis]|uniref:STAS domain-containing protein n=1 Tax=Streptomyces indiaensis TaxID=284033 RepID=A0ABN3DNY7_9ACTN